MNLMTIDCLAVRLPILGFISDNCVFAYFTSVNGVIVQGGLWLLSYLRNHITNMQVWCLSARYIEQKFLINYNKSKSQVF